MLGTTLLSSGGVGQSEKSMSDCSSCFETAEWQCLIAAGRCSTHHSGFGWGSRMLGLGMETMTQAKEAQWMECWGLREGRSKKILLDDEMTSTVGFTRSTAYGSRQRTIWAWCVWLIVCLPYYIPSPLGEGSLCRLPFPASPPFTEQGRHLVNALFLNAHPNQNSSKFTSCKTSSERC